AGGGIAQRAAGTRPRLPAPGDETLKLHERCSCSGGDLPLDAVGAAAEQRDALTTLIADHDFVNAVALGAPGLAGLGRELIALARGGQEIDAGGSRHGGVVVRVAGEGERTVAQAEHDAAVADAVA